MISPFGFWIWPFMGALVGIWIVLALLFLIVWIWAIVDAARRNFRNDMEKVIWILVLVFGSWIGLLVYLIVVKASNPGGLMKK